MSEDEYLNIVATEVVSGCPWRPPMAAVDPRGNETTLLWFSRSSSSGAKLTVIGTRTGVVVGVMGERGKTNGLGKMS